MAYMLILIAGQVAPDFISFSGNCIYNTAARGLTDQYVCMTLEGVQCSWESAYNISQIPSKPVL